jgi:uncharacterized membrane protein
MHMRALAVSRIHWGWWLALALVVVVALSYIFVFHGSSSGGMAGQ